MLQDAAEELRQYMRDAFGMLVLDERVLALADRYRADLLAGVVRLNNEGRHHAAYHQFTLWWHGRLGKGDRRVISSCCIWRICDRYPSVDGLHRRFVAASYFSPNRASSDTIAGSHQINGNGIYKKTKGPNPVPKRHQHQQSSTS